MKQTHQHIWVESAYSGIVGYKGHHFPEFNEGGRKCGDKTTYAYIDDSLFRTLPKCSKCWEGVTFTETWTGEIDFVVLPVKKILLRDYL